MKKTISTLLLAGMLLGAYAQTPADAIMMEESQVCAALLYNRDTWDEYWEGSLLRSNGNVGTFTGQQYQLMITAGVWRNLNVIVSTPYMQTSSTGGTLKGQHGFQDFGLWAKYKGFTRKIGKGNFNLLAEAGMSLPMSDYNNDVLPLSIGLGSKTASLRGLLNYYIENGPYATVNWGYTWRGNATLEREFYYSDGPHYTDEVVMPNVIDYIATIGFLNTRLKAELSYSHMITLQGADIRRQDAPLVSNRMIAGRTSAIVQFYFKKPKGLSLIAMGGQTLSGRNVGKTLSLGGGVAWQFGLWQPKSTASN